MLLLMPGIFILSQVLVTQINVQELAFICISNKHLTVNLKMEISIIFYYVFIATGLSPTSTILHPTTKMNNQLD